MRASVLCGVTAVSTMAAVAKDEIKALPGWDDALPSKIYSGFIDATPPGEVPGSVHMHYLFFESEGDPAEDPVLVWSNGGPGAASEFGLFTELGPLELSDASLKTAAYNATGIPSLFRNEHAWTKGASVLMYDSPPPVGFSYCDDNVGGDGYSCGDWDDFRTARTAFAFVDNWYTAFPEYAKNDLYLSGESYAGVYIPMLAQAILNSTSPAKDALKGLAIGDGCVGSEVLCGQKAGPWFNIEFFHGHGQVSDKLYNDILHTCNMQELFHGVVDHHCQHLIDKMHEAIGGYYGYNLYDECGAENVFLKEEERTYWSSVPPIPRDGGALNDYPCGGTGAMIAWLNRTEVQDAMHAPRGSNFFISDNGVGFNYAITEKNLMPFYKQLAYETDIRVLIYNGDTDPGINSFVSQNWTTALGFRESEAWRPWTLDGKQGMGGYVTRYEGDFDFLTIRGSGHMVPQYKPAASQEFITRWLKNENYQKYTPPPQSQRA